MQTRRRSLLDPFDTADAEASLSAQHRGQAAKKKGLRAMLLLRADLRQANFLEHGQVGVDGG